MVVRSLVPGCTAYRLIDAAFLILHSRLYSRTFLSPNVIWHLVVAGSDPGLSYVLRRMLHLIGIIILYALARGYSSSSGQPSSERESHRSRYQASLDSQASVASQPLTALPTTPSSRSVGSSPLGTGLQARSSWADFGPFRTTPRMALAQPRSNDP